MDHTNELICPNCGQVFDIDNGKYASLLAQVRNQTFEHEIEQRMSELKEHMKTEHEQRLEIKVRDTEAAKEKEITELKLRLADADSDIAGLKEKIEIRVRDTEAAKEKEITELKLKLADADTNIAGLKEKLEGRKNEEELLVKLKLREQTDELLREKDGKIAGLEAQLRAAEKQFADYREMSMRLSTKMVGETLEQHCEYEFRKIQQYLSPDRVSFGKDNDSSSGTKGDYIYRELCEDGTELISIMFEMKNEVSTTSNKHKNSDFYAKLDKDRQTKKCGYAVLVSRLEADNELFNQGITDVSFGGYDKMYVVRPQCFLTIISILRGAAFSAAEARSRVRVLEQQQIDVTNFEKKIDKFRTDFSKSCDMAQKRFNTAITDIDKAIAALQDAKEKLLGSLDSLNTAGSKINDQLTIKKLTHGNPTMRRLIEAAMDSSDE
ncbi:MAG: DUF2130 domain-containing protein [Ruminococcus sp.]|nr:DUF2130 domain-containing protein [Ruminococcus sp.]